MAKREIPRDRYKDWLHWNLLGNNNFAYCKTVHCITINPYLAQLQLFILAIKKCKNSAQINYTTLDFFPTVATLRVLRNVPQLRNFGKMVCFLESSRDYDEHLRKALSFYYNSAKIWLRNFISHVTRDQNAKAVFTGFRISVTNSYSQLLCQVSFSQL